MRIAVGTWACPSGEIGQSFTAVTIAGSLRTEDFAERGAWRVSWSWNFSLRVFNINSNQTYTTRDGFSLESLSV